MSNKLLISGFGLIFAVMMITSVAGAEVEAENLHPETAVEEGTATVQESNIFNDIFQAFAFLDASQTRFEPGEQANLIFDVTARVTTTDADFHVEINKCSESVAFNQLTSDDCNDNVDSWKPRLGEDLNIERGKDYDAAASRDLPLETGQYEIVAYIWKEGLDNNAEDDDLDGTVDEFDEQLASDAGRQFIQIVEDKETTQDTDGDGVIDSNDECKNTFGTKANGCPEPEVPNIEQASAQRTVVQEGDQIVGRVDLINTGDGDMSEPHIFEMQVNPKGSGVFSFVSSTQDTCGSDPTNVHKEFRLDAGDAESMELSVPVSQLEEGKTYEVWFITRSSCHGEGENNPVDPYGGGVNVANVEVSDTGGLDITEPENLAIIAALGIGVFLLVLWVISRYG